MDDIGTIDLYEVEDSGRPLMLLFKGLVGIGDVKKGSTTFTNTKILELLKKEFDVDVSTLHQVEVDIYMNVVKRFLEEWPQWDDYDQTITQIKKQQGNRDEILSFLDYKYAHLKGYLNTMLEVVKPMAEDALQNVELMNALEVKETEENVPNNIDLEIECTRDQLNKLNYNHPDNEPVFNIIHQFPPSIIMSNVSIEGLLNWHQVALVINMPNFTYMRRIKHDMKHTLIYKKFMQTTEVEELNRRLQHEGGCDKLAETQVATLLALVKRLAKVALKTKSSALKEMLMMFYNVIKKDLWNTISEIQVPGTYNRYMNKYPYVRYFYTDNNVEEESEHAKKYDLLLQETIRPKYRFCVRRAPSTLSELMLVSLRDKIFIKCEACNLAFRCNELHKFQCHMMERHQIEPDLRCTNCNKMFPVNWLARKFWRHVC